MNESEKGEARTTEESVAADLTNPQPDAAVAARQRKQDRQEARRWWIKLFVQPALLLAFGAIVIIGLGIAQRLGFISAGASGGQSHVSTGGGAVRHICPMMCTPPQSGPGRCPVCAMELVPLTSGGGNTDSRSIQIDPVARRIANIRTVAVTSMPMTRTIRAIGELSYDEGTLKTLSAYVDGRLDRLYADYTGVVVKQGDHLALVYSPRLYSGQVELLLAKKALEDSRSATLARASQFNRDLYESTRQRLIELGMTAPQIEQLERTGEANSRMHLCAPISGTVIEKFVVEGQYVKAGQAIYKLADLSTVWLMLTMFPEDAAVIRDGQTVNATVQSLPGRKFTGRVAFIDPHVDLEKIRQTFRRRVGENRNVDIAVGDEYAPQHRAVRRTRCESYPGPECPSVIRPVAEQ
ncbi:MAG: efflux RND transporter periplasmic adaptor subunit [Planctomycetes bacterium]|nr:efflux RND transporter periplasmic adaptor subunit [Planctomycetota bacterium]